MGDSFSETTHTGFGKRIVNSLSGLIIGPILFLASFGLLYWNEGRVDLSTIATDATIITATADSVAADGKLVSVTDKLSAQTPFEDNFLVDARYAALKRQSEIYQWKETQSSETTNNTGGSSDTTTTYSYDLVWTEFPIDSKNFKQPEGHENPASPSDRPGVAYNQVPIHVIAPDLMIGSLTITGGDSMTLPTLEPLQLTAA
ncbi:MAG: TMEM43 family protein, partial [Minisyncoccia bacterium]